MINIQYFSSLNYHRYLFIFIHPIDTIDLRYQFTIPNLQIHTLNETSILVINQKPKKTSNKQKFNIPQEIMEPYDYKDLSHVVENYDYS